MAKSNLLLRVLTALLLLPLAILIVYKGNAAILFGMVALIMAGSILEFFKLLGIHNASDKIVGVTAGLLTLYVAAFHECYFLPFLGITFCCLSAYLLFSQGIENFVNRISFFTFSIMYFPLLLSFPVKMLELQNGRVWLFFFLIVNWMTDSLAYFVGTQIGRLPLTRISPKKSIEGLAGGIAGGVLAAFLINYFALKSQNWFSLLALGAVGSIVGQIGDIVESGIKRCIGVKDSGSIIPGHGGIMDRFDSIYFTGILFYVYAKYIY